MSIRLKNLIYVDNYQLYSIAYNLSYSYVSNLFKFVKSEINLKVFLTLPLLILPIPPLHFYEM